MATNHRSLHQLHSRHYEAPLGVLVALATIIVGLSLPVMSIQKLVFWEDSYTIVQGAISLFNEGYYILGLILFAFSVVFPNLKLAILGIVWFVPLRTEHRQRTLWWLKVLGKWSMLDVFVIAVMIVLSQSKGALDAEPRTGLYVFAAGVLLSMVVTIWIDVLAERSEQNKGNGKA